MNAINSMADAFWGLAVRHPWSHVRNAASALILLIAVAILFWIILSQQRTELLNKQAELTQIEQLLKPLRSQAALPSLNKPDYTQRWPQRDEVNAVVRFLGALAQQHQVNLGQMTLSHAPSSAQAAGRVDISLSMNSAYASSKQVLSELLNRYPSLALQSLTAVSRSGDSSRIDWTLALTLYVKD